MPQQTLMTFLPNAVKLKGSGNKGYMLSKTERPLHWLLCGNNLGNLITRMGKHVDNMEIDSLMMFVIEVLMLLVAVITLRLIIPLI